jgi:diaminopimelate epimerase
MHGCGNDYIYVDLFQTPEFDFAKAAIALSDRHFGIGGDGIILVCPSDRADAKMRIFNADGSEGMMCGNGIRCVGKYVYDSGIARKDTLRIDSLSGVKTLQMTIEDGKAVAARVDMGAAILKPADIPVDLPGETAINVPLTVDGREYRMTCVSMGNPHAVIFVDCDPMELDLPKIGPSFEHHPLFPQRVNTEFVRVIDDHTLQMRVWERGSGETWACGTGTCASAVAAVLNGYCPKNEDILVHLRGGDLTIRYTDETVYMTGPATTVFTGEVEVEG